MHENARGAGSSERAEETRVHRWLKRGAAALIVLTIARVWLGPPGDAAQAQQSGGKPVPFDATAQRNDLLEEARKSNQILLGILDTLRNGTLRVEVHPASDEGSGSTGKKK
ncbi:MAG: hypothetical protein FLDDKLPJ_03126 [Phycisphaerae bacterium]|nr:hypothetical protein [Phycisphaerae bacterium]